MYVAVDELTLTSGAHIDSSSSGVGEGGMVTITATDVTLEAGSIFANSLGETEEAGNAGNAGNIRISALDLTLRDQSVITTETSQAGGGNIEIEAQTVSLVDSAMTTTVRKGEGSSGNITIAANIREDTALTAGVETLTIERGRIAANTDAGDGANIVIAAQQVILDESEMTTNTSAGVGGNATLAGTVAADGQASSRAGAIVLRESQFTANAQEGQGGSIVVVAEAFLADPASLVNASSQEGGIDGEVNIEAVVTNLSSSVDLLPQTFVEAQLRSECAKRWREGNVSRFVQSGRDGLPARPGTLLLSPLTEIQHQIDEDKERLSEISSANVGSRRIGNRGYMHLELLQTIWNLDCAS